MGKNQSTRCSLVGCSGTTYGHDLCPKHRNRREQLSTTRRESIDRLGRVVHKSAHQAAVMSKRQRSRVENGIIESSPDDYVSLATDKDVRLRDARHRLEDHNMMRDLYEGV